MQKHPKEWRKRLAYYKAALDLLRNSQITLDTIFRADDLNIILHRFYGATKDGTYFCVQVKQDKRSGRKDFMSVFDRRSR